ncbi:MAG TPA: hypothetical protein ENO14_03295 [Chromatiales bacterium]|nr:hypothetical protein [Chromatiales bacterium]
MAVAVVGPISWFVWRHGGSWPTGLSATLWVAVAASLAVFGLTAALSREGWRLGVLLYPYLILLAGLATVWSQAPEQTLREDAPPTWVTAHIVLSVLTYGVLTLAAIAGLAVLLRERNMAAKMRGRLSDLLPSIAGAESLQVRLLVVSEIVLGLGVVTGIATQFLETGRVLAIEHKTLLTIGGFVLIGALLFGHYRTGLRGRRAARIVLVAYLLVTLGYPGVKFVRDVLLG